MKIEQLSSSYARDVYKNNGSKKSGSIEGRREGKTSVEISTEAKALVDRLKGAEDTKFSDKVEQIRLSIKDGSYAVDTDKIADKIMEILDQQKVSTDEK